MKHCISRISLFFLLVGLVPSAKADLAISEIAPARPAKKTKMKHHDSVSKEMEFIAFQKETCCLGDPFEFSSPEAESLWSFLVSKEPRLARAWGENTLRNGGEFAALGNKSYLVFLDAFYFAAPNKDVLTRLTVTWPPGNPGEPEFRPLIGNRLWALVSGGDLSRGIETSEYYALFIDLGAANGPSVTSIELLSTVKGYSESDSDLCGDEYGGDIGSEIKDVTIKDLNHDQMEDIVFSVTQQNCKTKKIRTIKRIFVNQGNKFVEKRPKKHATASVPKDTNSNGFKR